MYNHLALKTFINHTESIKMNEEQILDFKFSVKDANAIMSVLGNAPYAQVAGIVAAFQTQAAPQIAAAAPDEEALEEVVAE